MASSSPAAELSLQCKPHSYSLLLKSLGDQTADQTQKLEDFLARLEEERLKIDAFKRELPLCMQLLNNAMETSRHQLQSYIANQGPKPVLEQFIPLQTTAASIATCEGTDDQKNIMSSTTTTTHTSDKANWMISAQLWSTQATGDQMNNNNNQQQQSSIKETEIGSFGGEKQIVGLEGLLPELTLASSEKELEEMKKNLEINSCGRVISNNGHLLEQQGKNGSCHGDSQGNSNNTLANNNNNNPQSAHRKARRCWSPDLHRRFVNALQMLGGSQVATPKQIRELMKVDGLTNDEVKSHLQKYRLHTRRPSPSPQVAATGAPQLVVLGGIWVPPEYAAAAAAHGGATAAALYGTHSTTTHHASPHYCAAPLPQEFYHHAPSSTQATPHHQLHHHHHPLYNQIHVYQQHPPPPQPPSQTQNSPESDFRGGGSGGLSESMEDGKSESGSWKCDSSGENGGRRKALVVREEGEESNGSEITLKF